jgi:hypothetical protein
VNVSVCIYINVHIEKKLENETLKVWWQKLETIAGKGDRRASAFLAQLSTALPPAICAASPRVGGAGVKPMHGRPKDMEVLERVQ